MSQLWMMIIVWSIVEFIGFLRKKEFRKRLESAAIWSTVAASFAAVGQMTPQKNALLQFAMFLVIAGTVASFIYFLRVKLYLLWKKKTAS